MAARYICIEGTDGVGKTTQVDLLVKHLRALGCKVLQTKEPGTPHNDLTIQLRKYVLDAQYDNDMTDTARELIIQATRSIHLEKVIVPALDEYDYIIQDRGILSSLSYGEACGLPLNLLETLNYTVIPDSMSIYGTTGSMMYKFKTLNIYDDVIILHSGTNTTKNPDRSTSREYETGDIMENKGQDFMKNVFQNMRKNTLKDFNNAVLIDVDNKSIHEVFSSLLLVTNLG